MPADQPAAGDTHRRLAGLERQDDFVVEGGIRPLSVHVLDDGHEVQPAVALWLDARTGLARSYRMFIPESETDGGLSQAITGLVDALSNPLNTSSSQPALPSRIRVDDPVLAEAVRALLEPSAVEVESVSTLPLMDEALASLESYLEEVNRSQPFVWDVDPAVLLPLYQAAAGYARRAPWDYMNDNPPFAVTLGDAGPQRNVRTLYGCVLGSARMVRGIAFYYSRAAVERAMETGGALLDSDQTLEEMLGASTDEIVTELRRHGLPVDDLPPEALRAALSDMAAMVEAAGGVQLEDALVVDFESTEEDDPTYLEWLQERKLAIASRDLLPTFTRTRRRGEPSLPTEREARALTLALEAVNGFLSRFRRRLATPFVTWEPLVTEVKVSDGRQVKVRWPGLD